MATQFFYDLDVPNVDYGGAVPNEEGELGFNATTKKMQVHDGSTVKPLAYEADLTPPLAAADQTLTGVRQVVTTGTNTLAVTGLVPASDDGHFIGLDDSAIFRVKRSESTQVLSNAGAPVNGTTIAWYVGQLLYDTSNSVLYRATAKSTDPDSGGAGSAWVSAITPAANLAVADQVLSGNRTIATGANNLLMTGVTADSDSGHILGLDTGNVVRIRNAAAHQTLLKNGAPVDGTDTAWYAGQLLVSTVNGDIYQASTKSTNPDSSAAGSVWVLRNPAPLALSNQTLSAARIITTTATRTLSIAGLVHNSDSQHRLVTASTIGRLQTVSDDVYRVLFGIVAPANSTVKAWYEGQLYVDTVSKTIYRASAKSTDPDTSAAGSVWEAVVGGSTPFAHTFVTGDWSAPAGGFRTINITQATHGKSASSPIHVTVQSDNGTFWVDVDPHRVTVNKTTGDVTLQIVDGTEFTGRAIVSTG